MKIKRYILPLIIVVSVGLLIITLNNQDKLNGSTIESRELMLKEISTLGEATAINQEIVIEDYIVSGYVADRNQHGLAIFVPNEGGKYRLQTHVSRQKNDLIYISATINQKLYNLFWANKDELDYAEITYTVGGKNGETMRLDASDNKILYREAPSNSFTIEYCFVDKNGNRYE